MTGSDTLARIKDAYTFSGDSVFLGALEFSGATHPEVPIFLPLSTLNRHGLISGATGTGKTKTIQKILEGLSMAGVPTVMMDMKGDVSGMVMPGEKNEKILSRAGRAGEHDWRPQGFPVEFFSLLGEGGSQIRVTVSEFGPLLFSRMFGLSDAQAGALTIAFRYADDRGLLLVNLADLKTLLMYIASDEGKKELSMEYGAIAPGTLQVLMRKILELEAQGGESLFGERSLEVQDFCISNNHDFAPINILRLMYAVRSPLVFSTFILSLLTEVYNTFPEVGDLPRPRLVFIVDEAHILFQDAPKAFLAEITMMMKLIRSKGVSVLFCTQNPADIPDDILGQLGCKIQHALRAFTAKDQEGIRKMAKNFPTTDDYDIEKELLSLGTGEVLVTVLNESGRPAPLARVCVAPPRSRMDVLSDMELQQCLFASSLYQKYGETLDPESAHEVLQKKIQQFQEARIQAEEKRIQKSQPSLLDTMASSVTKTLGTELGRSLGKTLGGGRGASVGAQIARSIFGSIFK